MSVADVSSGMVTSESGSADESSRSIPIRGALAVVLGGIVNVLLVIGAGALEVAPGFQPLSIPSVALFSTLGAIGATVVYWLLRRYALTPDRTFVRVAAVVLVLSFVPDFALLRSDPAATVPGVVLLMVMHVVVAAASVGLLVYCKRG